jgi:glutamate formiminotransferase/formiminotetrahydrofolate cyclodeaminase
MNVKINASGYNDKDFVIDVIAKGEDIENKTIALEKEIIEIVNSKIG